MVENKDLSNLATVDPLTGLPNQRALNQYLEGVDNAWERSVVAMNEAGDPNTVVVDHGSCIAIDLTKLKWTNDEISREEGDLFLRSVADAIKLHSRKQDHAFRLGDQADEFSIFLPVLPYFYNKIIGFEPQQFSTINWVSFFFLTTT